MTRPAEANAVVKINKSLGQESFRRIRDARKQLDSVDVPLRSRKFEEVQVILPKLLWVVRYNSERIEQGGRKDYDQRFRVVGSRCV